MTFCSDAIYGEDDFKEDSDEQNNASHDDTLVFQLRKLLFLFDGIIIEVIFSWRNRGEGRLQNNRGMLLTEKGKLLVIIMEQCEVRRSLEIRITIIRRFFAV